VLPDSDFKIVYSSGEHEPAEFFIDALLESNSFDLVLGFFSSSGFRALAPGFAYFIHHGGKMRIIFNDVLSVEDKEAIERGINSKPEELIETRIIEDLLGLYNTLSSKDRHFFNCISWLIATGRLEIMAIVPVNGRPGIAHPKFGLFKDKEDNTVVFSGSVNFSKSALFYNLEAMSCYRSWTNDRSDKDRIEYYGGLFNRIWTGKHNSARTISLDKVKTIIREKFPVGSSETLLHEEYLLVTELLHETGFPTELIKKLDIIKAKLSLADLPRILPPPDLTIRPYQDAAYNNWKKNGNNGLFAMATGTGKTITALNCVYKEYLEEYKLNNKVCYHLLILVPGQPLLQQWAGEIADWGIKKSYLVSGKSNWREELQELANDFQFGIDSDFAIVATYQTFTNPVFQSILSGLPSNTIVIADEAHNMGQPSVRELLPKFPFNKRIGLSATPKRIYDPQGTALLEEFFNDREPYCFSFTMEEAIKEGRLCRYEYYPRLVELEHDELDQYIQLSKRIAQLSHMGGQEDGLNANLERLLLMRKRIVNKANQKLVALRNIISEIKTRQPLKYCFTYAPEGENSETELEEDNKRIIREMQQVFEQASPQTRTHVYLGETQNREEVLEGFERGQIDVLLAIKCLDEGVDVPQTGIGIFTASTGNPRQYIQRRGRLLRMHDDKHQALIYDMVVIPKIFGESGQEEFFKIEQSLVKSELMRVGYFASLSENFYETKKVLQNICQFYKLDLDTLILDLEK
jgi:superfamily II DNA or RNA helicase